MISSGFGLGAALMDQFLQIRYFLDVDNYRDKLIDWECFGVRLSFLGLQHAVLAGWFTVDTPDTFNRLQKGLLIPTITYVGGDQPLSEFIQQAQILLQSR